MAAAAAIHSTTLTFVERVLLKTFQKRKVSSPAPVTMASPSGDIAYGQEKTTFSTCYIFEVENESSLECRRDI